MRSRRRERAEAWLNLFDILFLFGLVPAVPLIFLVAVVAAVRGHGDQAIAYLVWAGYPVRWSLSSFQPDAPLATHQRSDRNAARTSVAKSSGSSQAAKCPPLAGLL